MVEEQKQKTERNWDKDIWEYRSHTSNE